MEKIVKTKHKRKRPEFTFEDGMFFNFYLERGGRDSDISNLCVFCQIAGDSTGSLNKDRILHIIKLVDRALRESSEICSQWEHKPLRKKLKLYIKWLQSEMSKKEPSK